MSLLGVGGPNLGLSFFAPLTELFTGKGTAALGAADTGQAWWTVDNGAPNAGLSLIGGKLTNSALNAGVAAGYVEANIGANVVRLGGRFTLSAGDPGGNALFIVWRRLLRDTFSIPDSACHLAVGRNGWNYGVWQGGTLTSLGNGALTLTADDATIYTCDITFSGTSATLNLPDGQHALTDARIASLMGVYPCFEVYQGVASTDSKPKFTEVWVNT